MTLAACRVKRLREKFESELRELERSERAAVEKHLELRRQQIETEEELIRLQATLRQKEQEIDKVTRVKDVNVFRFGITVSIICSAKTLCSSSFLSESRQAGGGTP